ncbi:MAG: hypothetical protein NTY20_03290 [Candidatus Aenigmarchaeota archaeon]|jgi:hypothetical protein|nr:hypothetical protein [Candidatus Aenigmarchaeota archaeon]
MIKIDKSYLQRNEIVSGTPIEIHYQNGAKELGYYKNFVQTGCKEEIIFENSMGLNCRFADSIEMIFKLERIRNSPASSL